MPKKLNSMSFRKTRRPTIWCALETDLFYGILIFLFIFVYRSFGSYGY